MTQKTKIKPLVLSILIFGSLLNEIRLFAVAKTFPARGTKIRQQRKQELRREKMRQRKIQEFNQAIEESNLWLLVDEGKISNCSQLRAKLLKIFNGSHSLMGDRLGEILKEIDEGEDLEQDFQEICRNVLSQLEESIE